MYNYTKTVHFKVFYTNNHIIFYKYAWLYHSLNGYCFTIRLTKTWLSLQTFRMYIPEVRLEQSKLSLVPDCCDFSSTFCPFNASKVTIKELAG